MLASLVAWIRHFFLNVRPWVIINPWEEGLRVRLGKHVKPLAPGIWFRIPFVDIVYSQSVRLRMTSIDRQTLTSRDGYLITLEGAIGFSITHLEMLYRTIHMPDQTVKNVVRGAIARYIASNHHEACTPSSIQNGVHPDLSRLKEYGINVSEFDLVSFVKGEHKVRNIRLIGDHGDRYESYMDTSSPRPGYGDQGGHHPGVTG